MNRGDNNNQTVPATLDDWLLRLESLHPREIELGLDRVKKVFDRLSISHIGKIITVAGTNGKGSCVATLEALCIAENKSVGSYTSPHFLKYNERIRINGVDASDQAIVCAFHRIEKARGEISLTYFEFGTLAAFLLFAEADLDYWVLEVGLGGRLDAVNILDADVAILTSIDLDHQDWLGSDREAIGHEKAGIFRHNKPAICVDQNPPNSVTANSVGCKLLLAGHDIQWRVSGNAWDWQGITKERNPLLFRLLPLPQLPLASVAAAIQAASLLGFQLAEPVLVDVLKSLQLTGRRQWKSYRGHTLLLDVAHNPAAAQFLAERLADEPGNMIAVFAVMADKDYSAIISALATKVGYWINCGLLGNKRAATTTQLRKARLELGLLGEECDTVSAGLERALSMAKAGQTILIVGSFYTVTEVLALIEHNQ